MAKLFYFYFGNRNPNLFTGLSPEFIQFSSQGVGLSLIPLISELPSGSGIYQFSYGSTASTSFVIDGGSTLGTSPFRYVSGVIDPVMAIDQSIGSPSDSIGQGTDPTTIFGQYKRNQEFNEGYATFYKSSLNLQMYDRTNTILFWNANYTNTSLEISVSSSYTGASGLILLTDAGIPILTDSGVYLDL